MTLSQVLALALAGLIVGFLKQWELARGKKRSPGSGSD